MIKYLLLLAANVATLYAVCKAGSAGLTSDSPIGRAVVSTAAYVVGLSVVCLTSLRLGRADGSYRDRRPVPSLKDDSKTFEKIT